MQSPDVIIYNAAVTTLDPAKPNATALAITAGLFSAVGETAELMATAGANTQTINVGGRRVIPGLIDSHIHFIRGGLNYNMELRWDGLPCLADAMSRLKEQVARTPPPQWVRVVGGFTEHQFAEKRLPTLAEINAVAPDTPVFILHLYDRALLNAAALRAVGYTRDTPNPPGGEVVRDSRGALTGLLLAQPNAMLLYSALAKGPTLPYDYQLNSTRHFMRELNRLGITSIIDAGGGYQSYPDDYRVINDLHQQNLLTLRIAYNLFPQKPKEELTDFANWSGSIKAGQGDDFYRHNGAGEMLVFSAADFEDFRQPRADIPASMKDDLTPVVSHLVKNRWPFRMHATYDETIGQALDVFEAVNRAIPFDGLHWFFDHAETVSDANLARIAALGGGIAVQHRMAYQGEYFVARYGQLAAERTPPVKRMLEMGVNVGLGTDATRVASYDPWNALYWLVTGKTVGGLSLYPTRNLIDRTTALRTYTHANTWFSNEDGKKGQIMVGQLADLAVLSADYFNVADEDIRQLVSVLTVVGGNVVHASDGFAGLAPALPPAMPDWSPTRSYDGYYKRYQRPASGTHSALDALASATCGCNVRCNVHGHAHARAGGAPTSDRRGFWGALGCACWAV